MKYSGVVNRTAAENRLNIFLIDNWRIYTVHSSRIYPVWLEAAGLYKSIFQMYAYSEAMLCAVNILWR